MADATPTIANKEQAKVVTEPETTGAGSPSVLGKHPRLQYESPPSIGASPVGSATSSSDDTPKWREIEAARKRADDEEEDKCAEAQAASEAEAAFLSPAKTVFTHKAESGITPDGASGSQQANLRVGMQHPGVPGHSESFPVHPATPSWAKK